MVCGGGTPDATSYDEGTSAIIQFDLYLSRTQDVVGGLSGIVGQVVGARSIGDRGFFATFDEYYAAFSAAADAQVEQGLIDAADAAKWKIQAGLQAPEEKTYSQNYLDGLFEFYE